MSRNINTLDLVAFAMNGHGSVIMSPRGRGGVYVTAMASEPLVVGDTVALNSDMKWYKVIDTSKPLCQYVGIGKVIEPCNDMARTSVIHYPPEPCEEGDMIEVYLL